MTLFSGTITALEQGLKYSSLNQKVIAQNIANSDTPNYKAKTVRFKDMFNQAQSNVVQSNRTDARHYQFTGTNIKTPGVVENKVSYQNDGNSVDIDNEMADLATNQIYYNALISRVSSKFNTLNSVVKGGR